MPSEKIPFNAPWINDKQKQYVLEAFAGAHASGDGPFTKQCHAFFEKHFHVGKALLTTSCTHALEMSALLLDIKPGDEVIVPSFTFVSTINAFVLRGAVPVFIDIHPDTLNLDETQLPGCITSKTRAIVPVHYAGVGCEMDAILAIARQHNIAVVEDNAHGLFGKYKGKFLGTFGDLATQSFHETKNFSCGEGGALLINRPELVERAEIIREKGTNRSRFFRGQVDKYTWVDAGSSYLPSDFLAAMLLAQLEDWQEIQRRRKVIWEFYAAHLRDWADANGARLPFVPEHCEQPYHMFYLLMSDLNVRTRFIAHLKANNILSVFHYLPLHAAPAAKQFCDKSFDCPVTNDISDRLVRLPFFNHLSQEQMTRVVDTILKFKS
jgi:dTDP-4-amino-4,6-dideoxygalactose transaminase